VRRRRNYLIISILYFLVCIVIILWPISGCSTIVHPRCRHNAIYQAITFSDLTGCPVRIAVGPTPIPGIAHAQAQAFVDGEWKWLTQGPNGIGTGFKYPFFTVKEYVSVEEALHWLHVKEGGIRR